MVKQPSINRSANRNYVISRDKSKIDVDAVHHYLCYQSYWAKGRSRERVIESIEHSICFGMYDLNGHMLGFARVVTDKVVFAYVMDLFVFEQYQGQGLGKALVKHIVEQPDLQVKMCLLATDTAHGLYQKFGFSSINAPEKYMIKRDALRF